MKRHTPILLIILLALIICLTVNLSPAAGQPQESAGNANDFLILVDIRVENSTNTARIILQTNRFFDYIDYNLENQTGGIVFDPAEPLYVNMTDVNFDTNGIINEIRLVKSFLVKKGLPLILNEGFYPLDYIVINLKSDAGYRISQRANLIVIDIGESRLALPDELTSSFTIKDQEITQPKKETTPVLEPQAVASDFLKSRAKSVIASPAPLAARNDANVVMDFKTLRDQILEKALSAKTPIINLPQGKNLYSFNDCLQIATVNSMQLTIAEEDIKLNDMKINEAKRGLYPTATAKYTTSSGKAQDVEFTEKTYGMQVEQPIYYGGRLKLTLKQAQINRQVAQAKYDKAQADVISKITETFYNFATAQLNLVDQKGLLFESRNMLSLAQKKYEQELTTKLELLNVESQCNQIDYQMSVAAKDVDIARTNLLQAMSADPQAEIKVGMPLDYKENIIDLNKCLFLAYKNRPELHMNELLEEAAGYEQKIAKSKDDIKVDFTGFMGQSGSAYVTEPLNMGSDWFVGVKASKPWLGNTGSYNFTQNKTSPKLGQDSRTQSKSNSFELGLLNNLTGYSEKQSALIGKLKAENELIEIEKSINTEVRETYNNYEKAVLQIQNTQEKIRFRQEELKVLQSQADLNEATLSQVLDAMVKLNDEKALYHQAIASYKTALANLNKAIGLMGYFD